MSDQLPAGAAVAVDHAGAHSFAVPDVVPPPPRNGRDFPALDALRAVGAVAVLTTHVAFNAGSYTRHGVLGALLSRMDVGVALFFVLSGFLLARPWLASAADGRPLPAAAPYLRRRFWRIAPLYVVTAVLALTVVSENHGLGWGVRLRTLLMLNTFGDLSLPAGLAQMWSLAVEVSFYLVLPVLMLLMLGRTPGRISSRRVAVGLSVMAALTVWWFLDGASRIGAHTSGLPVLWLPAYLTWFGAGIALAWVQVVHEQGRHPRLTSRVEALAAQPGSCWALAAGLLLVAASPVAGPILLDAPTTGQEVTKNLLYALIATLVVLTGVFAVPGSTYSRFMAHPAARRLGYISFGVFCLHLAVLYVVMSVTGWTLFQVAFWPLWLITVAVSFVLAEVAYRLIERPGMAWGHRRAQRSRRRSRRGRDQRSTPPSSAASGTTIT